MSITVLIAGFGYLGHEIAEILLEDDHTVIGVKRRPDTQRTLQEDEAISVLQSRIADLTPQQINQANVIIYCPSPDGPDEASYKACFFDDAKHILSLAQKSPLKPPIIYVSTSAVCGVDDGSWVDENTLCEPPHPRYKAILAAEKMLLQSKHPAIIVRPSGLYGKDKHPLLDALLQQKSHVCHKTRYSNRIHVTDCARAIYHIMHLKDPEPLYLLSDANPTPINQIIAWLSSVTGKPIPEDRVDASEDVGDFRTHKRLSSSRLIETGFYFEYPSYKQGFKQILLDMGLIHPEH